MGNVSEYYTEGGQLKIFGFSAYDYADPHDNSELKTSDYVGGEVGAGSRELKLICGFVYLLRNTESHQLINASTH